MTDTKLRLIYKLNVEAYVDMLLVLQCLWALLTISGLLLTLLSNIMKIRNNSYDINNNNNNNNLIYNEHIVKEILNWRRGQLPGGH